MKILISLHSYPPHHCAGGEMYIHNMAKQFVKCGHQVRVLYNHSERDRITRTYELDGVEVWPRNRSLENFFIWADRIITHLGFTSWTVGHAQLVFKKPVFFVVQNTHHYSCVSDPEKPVGIIYNSEWAKEKLQYRQPNIVLTPPVDFREHDLGLDPNDNKYITLINLNENKGGKIFWDIARAMPERQFLAVKGAYDDQIIQNLPNVTVADHTPNIADVYRATRILLMPSAYESWGMTATEAMCNGIPVICTPTPGLKENCGNAALYVGKPPDLTTKTMTGSDVDLPKVSGRDDVAAWVKQIRSLDNKKTYLHRSKLCRERSRALDPQKRYESLLDFVINPYDPKYLH